MVHNKIKKRIRRFRRKIRKFPLLMVILVSLTIGRVDYSSDGAAILRNMTADKREAPQNWTPGHVISSFAGRPTAQ